MVPILCCSTASNVASAGGADGSDDDEVEVAQEQEAVTPDMNIGGETEDSQSSAGTSSRLTMPLPSTPVSRPTLGKRMQHGPKKDTVEEKLMEIIQQPESKPDEEELICLNLAAKLRKIKDPQKKEYAQLQLQQTLYNCMYGDALSLSLILSLSLSFSHNNCHNNFLPLWTINKVLHQACKVIIIL